MKLKPLVLVLCVTIMGCGAFAHVADSVRRSELTPGGKRLALDEKRKQFHTVLVSQVPQDAFAIASEDGRKTLRAEFKKRFGIGRVVDITDELVDYNDDLSGASVEVTYHHLNPSTSTVVRHSVIERWQYSFTGGWELTEIDRNNDA